MKDLFTTFDAIMSHFISDTEIRRLQNELEKNLNWGPSNKWHSSMFNELSEKIFDDTQIMLSSTTLKRFFGILNHEGTPSITTLDALSAYLDYDNWRAFKISKKKHFGSIFQKISVRSIYVSLGFLLAIFTVITIANKGPGRIELPKGINFTSKTLSNTFPNSVVFDFDLKNIDSDSIYIQQYWDRTKTIRLNTDQKQATGIYYFPGYFRAKLIIDGNSILEHDLFLKSQGWIGTIEYEPIPKYFEPFHSNEVKLICPKTIQDEIVKSSKPLVTAFHNINDLGNISGDNFQLEASLKNSFDEKWAVCQSNQIYIIGTKGAMIIPFSKIGCSSDNNLMLNDVYLNGKENDLSALNADFSEFQNIKIRVNNKSVYILIQGKEVYQNSYLETMGEIVGIRFKFLGIGEVESFHLQNLQGKEIFLSGNYEN